MLRLGFSRKTEGITVNKDWTIFRENIKRGGMDLSMKKTMILFIRKLYYVNILKVSFIKPNTPLIYTFFTYSK